MGATYTRQSSFTDGDVITADLFNNEYDQLLAAFAASTGHTHDGTAAEGGPITKLLGTSITIGDATSGTDITVTFDGETNDGVFKWMEDEDYFEFSDDLLIASTEKIQFRDTAIYINSSTDGQLDIVADSEIQIAATTIDINGNVDISGTLTIGGAGISEAELEILDGATVTTTEINILDGDTTASSTTVADADRVVFNDAGTMKQVAVTDLAAYFDDEITAMPNLVTTAATTVGALNSGSITSGFGTIDTGSSTITTTGLISGGSLDIDDVLINGTTIGHTDDTDLITLANGVVTVAGEVSMTTLDIGGTNVTSTATELNLLDGVSGLVQADFTKLAAVDSTAAELNIVDGGTSATATTVADADRVVMNDNGTMVQVAVTDLAAYFDDEITAMPNLVTTAATTVGALNSGSITSGFGTIDTGSSAITTTGVITGGTLEATTDTAAGDNAAIGYTAAEGLILTGQGSTSDITLKNDADATVFTVPTGSDDILFPDNAKILMGAGSDLQIYHNATHSYIDNNTGNIYIRSNVDDDDGGNIVLEAKAGENGIIIADDGDVSLHFNGNLKLATTNTGVDITGGFTANDGSTITTADNTTQLTLISTDADASKGPILDLFRNSANPAVNDIMGQIKFIGEDDGGNQVSYARINTEIESPANGNEIGRFNIITLDNLAGSAGEHERLTISGTESVFNEDSADIDFRVESNGNANMLFVDGGNDAVGIGTSSPSNALHVNSGASNTAALFESTDAISIVSHKDNSTTNLIASGANGNNYVFYNGSEAMRIDSSGRLLLGNTDGSYASANADNIVMGDRTSSANSGITFGSTVASSLRFADAGAVGQGIIQYVHDDTSNTDYMNFYTAAAERMRIDSSGSFQLSPASNQGTFRFGNQQGDGSGIGAQFYLDSSQSIWYNSTTSTADKYHAQFINGNGLVGHIKTNGSATAYNTSSDYRLKTDAQPMTGASDRVLALKPVNFEWIADGTRVDGFLAHEAQAVVPEAVTGTKDAMRDEEYQVSAATGDIYTAGSEAGFNEVSAAIEASPAYYDVDGNIIKAEVIAKAAVHEAYDAVEEVIHSTNVAQPETLEDGKQWRETTAAVMGTRSVPDMQGIDQSKMVPLLVAALQDALARITALENA